MAPAACSYLSKILTFCIGGKTRSTATNPRRLRRRPPPRARPPPPTPPTATAQPIMAATAPAPTATLPPATAYTAPPTPPPAIAAPSATAGPPAATPPPASNVILGEGSGTDWGKCWNEVPQYWAELLPVLLADQQRMREQAEASKPLGAMEASNLDGIVARAKHVHQVAELHRAHRELEALNKQPLSSWEQRRAALNKMLALSDAVLQPGLDRAAWL